MAEISAAQTAPIARPARAYAPSWFDRFTDRVDDLSIPVGLFYAGFAAILVGIQLVIQWNGTIGSVYPFPLAYIFTVAYDLALMHYLDRVAAQALARFRPLLSLDDAEYADVLYRLTTMPARPALGAMLVGALIGIWVLDWIPFDFRIQVLHFANTPLSVHFNQGLTPLLWGIVILWVYHAAHQLWIVQQIYNRCPRVNLYTLRPLYAFSTLSARTAVGGAFIAYMWYLCAPQFLNFGGTLAALALFTGFFLLTFVLPLRGAHRLLVEEKDRLLTENGERQRAAVAELHRRVDGGEMVDMDNLNKTMASLELEHDILDRVSTWPWNQETFRVVTAALFFPVMVWLTQWILQRVLGT